MLPWNEELVPLFRGSMSNTKERKLEERRGLMTVGSDVAWKEMAHKFKVDF